MVPGPFLQVKRRPPSLPVAYYVPKEDTTSQNITEHPDHPHSWMGGPLGPIFMTGISSPHPGSRYVCPTTSGVPVIAPMPKMPMPTSAPGLEALPIMPFVHLLPPPHNLTVHGGHTHACFATLIYHPKSLVNPLSTQLHTPPLKSFLKLSTLMIHMPLNDSSPNMTSYLLILYLLTSFITASLSGPFL